MDNGIAWTEGWNMKRAKREMQRRKTILSSWAAVIEMFAVTQQWLLFWTYCHWHGPPNLCESRKLSLVLCSVLRIPFPRSPFDVTPFAVLMGIISGTFACMTLLQRGREIMTVKGHREGRGADQGYVIKLKYGEKRKSTPNVFSFINTG